MLFLINKKKIGSKKILAIGWWKIICKCRNAGKKVNLASAFLPVISWFSPASGFKSGTAGHGLV